MSSSSTPLSEQFGISGEIHFTTLAGLDVLEISNVHGSGRILLQGALLLDWIPRGHHPVVWVSPKAKFIPGKAPRGGVPVCWPWFGAHETNATFPAHGIARTARWDIVETNRQADQSHRLVFRLQRGDAPLSHWPYDTPLEIRYTLGKSIEIELITRNSGHQPITLTEALHTYFEVSDVRDITISGLEGCSYIDKVEQGTRKLQSDTIRFSAETDRVYLDTTETCVIHDPGYQRCIRIEKQNSRSTIVWNPWIEKAASMGDYTEDGYLRMVCVESGNTADNTLTLEAGAEHRLWVRYSEEPLSRS